MDFNMRETIAVLACMVALALAGCTSTGAPDADRLLRDARIARGAYCALPEATRQAIRDKATDGFQIVPCE